MASVKILWCFFFVFFVLSHALDMSIINYDKEHGQIIADDVLLPQRTDYEFRAMYESWLVKHRISKNNGIGENEKRFEIFKDNVKFIDQHNAENRPYKLGLNRFADLTHEEYRLKFVGGRMNRTATADDTLLKKSKVSDRYAFKEGDDLPKSVDWRSKGAVVAVKDQGHCGSCWAFSTVGAIEGTNQIATGDLISLSEQELVDCDQELNQGCNGGLMDYAFAFVIKNGGLDKEEDYPYNALDGTCDLNRKNTKFVSIDGYEDVPQSDEQSLKKAVSRQPVSVAIEAGGRAFQLYQSGVFTGECGTNLDHGVVAIGYGTEKGKDYWIVRNSWGTEWGEKGYIKLERNLANTTSGGKCGIALEASYPLKTSANPVPAPPSPVLPPAAPAAVCDDYYTCPQGTTCCCIFPYNNVCFVWGCCPYEAATCCADHYGCCPHDYPICGASGTCQKNKGSPLSVYAWKKSPAILRNPLQRINS